MNSHIRDMPALSVPSGVFGKAAFGAEFDRSGTHRLVRRAGSIVKLEGESSGVVYFVKSGWLAASKSTADGRRLIVDVVLPGEVLEPGYTIGDVSLVEIEALSRAVIVPVPREDWLRRLEHQPGLAAALDRQRRAATARMAGRMLRLGKGSADSRIAFALFELCLRSSAADPTGDCAMRIPMTQQQLGDFCGLSSVHVCRTMRRLVRDGLIEVSGKMNIAIRDSDALAEIAEVCPETLRHELVPDM